MRHLIDTTDLTLDEMNGLLSLAQDIVRHPDSYCDVARQKKLATLFYESSTRTRLSFEAAMIDLGGSVLGFSSAESSSATKGESVADTARVVSKYADIIAIRHPKEGAPFVASLNSEVPVINAGDGGHSHPTQTLTDLLTILETTGRLDSLSVGFCGDLKFGRTVHSLLKELVRYRNMSFYLISPPELALPDYIRQDVLLKSGCPFVEVTNIEDAVPNIDILYMTRVQRERFLNEAEYIRLKDTYVLTLDRLSGAKPDMKILHPLPRVNEIAREVDSDPRALYFEQARYGKFVRMALIMKLLGLKKGGLK